MPYFASFCDMQKQSPRRNLLSVTIEKTTAANSFANLQHLPIFQLSSASQKKGGLELPTACLTMAVIIFFE
jgi:hypothetical protein